MARLVEFLPGFEQPARLFCTDSGVQHPVYDDDVVEFFMLIGMEPWVDPGYRSLRPERFVSDPALIAGADFFEVRALLNLCSRGERFCDGYWLSVLENGVIQAALKRLQVLRLQFR